MIYLYIEKIKNKLYNFSEASNDKNKYEKINYIRNTKINTSLIIFLKNQNHLEK